jgi:hypothetical protein
MSDFPREHIIMYYRGVYPDGKPHPRRPIGLAIQQWEEDTFNRFYREGAKTSGEASGAWFQRVTINSQDELDELNLAISEKREKIDLSGIDAETVAILQQRISFDNTSRTDGRVRTTKGVRTREVTSERSR